MVKDELTKFLLSTKIYINRKGFTKILARNSPKHLERFVCLSMKTFADIMLPKGWNV